MVSGRGIAQRAHATAHKIGCAVLFVGDWSASNSLNTNLGLYGIMIMYIKGLQRNTFAQNFSFFS